MVFAEFSSFLSDYVITPSIIVPTQSLVNAVQKMYSPSAVSELPSHLKNLPVSRLVLSGNFFVKVAGVSGAIAVVLGSYGAHSKRAATMSEKQKNVFNTTNNYHLIHSLALFGASLSRIPIYAGSMLTLGLLLHCGGLYYEVITEKTIFRKFVPVGGMCFILGWIFLLL